MGDVRAESVGGEGLECLVEALQSATGCDLSEYSDKSLRRRMRKLSEDEQASYEQLLERLQERPAYAEHLLNKITVNTSELFRDPPMWQALRSQGLLRLRHHSQVSVWHAGCSMGQEVYSMLMLLNELGMMTRTKVYATDVNSEVLARAREGQYRYRFNLDYLNNFDRVINTNPLDYTDKPNVPYEKYLEIDREADWLRVRECLRSRPSFRRNDLTRCENPFYVKYDVIFCRNVIIYFNKNLQSRLFRFFYQNLYPGGLLVLGQHETIAGTGDELFMPYSEFYLRRD